MYSLSLNLITIFLLRLLTQQITMNILPWITYKYKVAGGAIKELLFSNKPSMLSRPELEFLLEPYDTNRIFIDDMMDAVIQFGYMSLFVTAFPAAAAVALVSNIISIKGKAWKLLNVHQRPAPVAAEDIGQFQSLLLFTAICAVITNAALTVFTMNVLDSFSDSFRFWIFIGFQWICFSAQAIIMEAIPDEPEEIVFHKRRAVHLESKIIDRVEDDVIEQYSAERMSLQVQEYPTSKGGFFKDTENASNSGRGFSSSGVGQQQSPMMVEKNDYESHEKETNPHNNNHKERPISIDRAVDFIPHQSELSVTDDDLTASSPIHNHEE